MQYGKVRRARYLFSREHDVIHRWQKNSEPKSEVIQPTTSSMLGVYNSCSYTHNDVVVTWYFSSSCCSEPQCTCIQLSPFYYLSILDVMHVSQALCVLNAIENGAGLGKRLCKVKYKSHSSSNTQGFRAWIYFFWGGGDLPSYTSTYPYMLISTLHTHTHIPTAHIHPHTCTHSSFLSLFPPPLTLLGSWSLRSTTWWIALQWSGPPLAKTCWTEAPGNPQEDTCDGAEAAGGEAAGADS